MQNKKHHYHVKFWILASLFLCSACAEIAAQETSPMKLKALYNSLDPNSLPQHLAFYDLYPNTPEGQKALQDIYQLLTGVKSRGAATTLRLPPTLTSSIHAIVDLVNKDPSTNIVELNPDELATIDKLASRLTNRRLKGYQASSEEEILKLPAHEIDLGRGILLTQMGNDPDALRKIRSYEASMDLMALQILTKVSLQDNPEKKIGAINQFIFEEMGFRFPPHSTFTKNVDLYTFLPSVLDSRRGVCLGVSILYICLAQRLNLELQMVTPPGHIFVRWCKGDKIINIETTARGIHLPDEEYLGVDTRSLQQRNVKEVIGLAHFNQASVYWERKEHDKACEAYTKAQMYLPQDKQLMELRGFNALLQGDKEKGNKLLQSIVDYLPDHAVSKGTVAEDYLNGKVDVEGIEALFMHTDEDRKSLLIKKNALETVLEKHPQFREGIFSLAGVWLQLHRMGEALHVLQRYHAMDPHNATVEYHLAAIYAERQDFNNAWKHFRLAEELVKQRQHTPQALLEMRQSLARQCPE